MNYDIRQVHEENRREIVALRVSLEQRGFIETIEECLAEAAQWKQFRPVGLYVDDLAVGFAMYGSLPDSQGGSNLWIDRMLIYEQFQRKGYGRKFMELLIDRVLQEYGEQPIYLSVYKENEGAVYLYKTLGFGFIGEYDTAGEEIMRMG
ncbi:GNAT family N-acetyltransferase [Sporosarcina gallistercoris]|uniref:GNAT family N-acetyltransferase n=1 Tax=Sporosarcina gallistercoris TaxID=2762245 RepID=A0ABR8PK46_9BACL|nr:GNAT family N-acetyltransferase [Sporosarcina gallistercoris]MBD7908535.1 GNAT family N-acetyltransferase [Sporosarcina gallistercoris]